jgi:hypothetical protein
MNTFGKLCLASTRFSKKIRRGWSMQSHPQSDRRATPILKLSVSELPMIPEMPDAPESLRRVAALHRELSRLSEGKTYFLSCRDTAKACSGLSYQVAYNINLALARLGVLEIVRIGDARPNGKASKFRYLLAQTENGASQAETGSQASKEAAGQNADDCDT